MALYKSAHNAKVGSERTGKFVGLFMMFAVMTLCMACTKKPCHTATFGVFLDYEGDFTNLQQYETVVIDAQYISSQAIADFKEDGHTVYSYINVGALENFREYSSEYESLMLGEYAHWEEEHWVDVADKRWQDFILKDLSKKLLEKNIDGFFVDNCDVYYRYPNEEIMEGLSVILEGLRATGKDVIINGGDCFVNAYCNAGGDWKDILTGINQESVFSSIHWENAAFGRAGMDERTYFMDYIEKYGKQGADIYLLEYTKDPLLVKEIVTYCEDHHFSYYITDQLQLGLVQ